MPVEIKELQINVTVNQQQAAPGTSGAPAPDTNADEKKAIINQCIEQVIEIFNNKKER